MLKRSAFSGPKTFTAKTSLSWNWHLPCRKTREDLNLRQEVRTTLRNTKALRVHNGGSKKGSDKGAPANSTQQTLLDDQLGKLREANAVLSAQVETLTSENTYLKAELEKARAQLAERWKDSE